MPPLSKISTYPSKVRPHLHFFSRPKSKLDTLKRIISGVILSYASAKTPATWIALNKLAESLSLEPKANISQIQNDLPNNIDSFVKNCPQFAKVQLAISQEKISREELNSLDLNNNGTILDSKEEIEKLIKIFQKKLTLTNEITNNLILIEAINPLNEINTISQLLWGKDGFNTKEILQLGANCQITADIIGNSLTHKNLQRLKSLIQVTAFNPGSPNLKDYFIDSIVKLNGKDIHVPFREIVAWRGIRSPANLPEGPYILAYAIEKELKENYTPIPHSLLSASSTLITRSDHTELLLPVLSDKSIIQILKEAPKEVIKLGSYPNLSQYFETIKTLFGKDGFYETETSNFKIIPNHTYTVKEYRYKDSEHLVTLQATDPENGGITESTLTFDELRQNFISISAPKNFVKPIDYKTLETYLIAVILLIGVRKSISYLEKRQSTKTR